MPFRIEHRIGVPAPPAVVWRVLADLERWPDWNPFYVRATGHIGFGERLSVTQALPDGGTLAFNPTVVDWTPDSQLLWSVSERYGMIRRLQYIEIEKLTDEGCIFSVGENWSGRLSNYVARNRRRAIHAGFVAMCEAMRERAIETWRAEGGAPTSDEP